MDYYYGEIGNMTGNDTAANEKKYTIIQSLWTKPVKDKAKMSHILVIAALSLAYAHRSGYKVHMHTDSKGYEMLENYGYEGLYKTLDKIPDTVPTELFAAGKFYAMIEEGVTGVVHTDFDVFLKKQGVIDCFFTNKDIDVLCQQEEDYDLICNHHDKIRAIHVLGYPATTRPNWKGSLNTGIIGFNNKELAEKYIKNYQDALKMYTEESLNSTKRQTRTTVCCLTLYWNR